MFARARPALEMMPPAVLAAMRRRGAQKAPTKAQTTLRLDADVLEHFRATGRGWQSRMNDALRAAAGLSARP